MLGRLQQTGTSKVSYADAEPALTELLRNFGPPDRKTSPAYPFHHLQSDGIWTVDSPAGNDLGASRTQLRGSGATGQLPTKFEAALRKDARLVAMAARFLLDANFPESLHSDICAVVGLDLEAVEVRAARQRAASLRRRDPQFRDAVLVAYEYRCAMCSYDGRLGTEAVGLDAAHVRWWAFDGPDSVDNAFVSAPSITSCSTGVSSASQMTTPSRSRLASWGAAGPPKCSSWTCWAGPSRPRSGVNPSPAWIMFSGTAARSSPAPLGFPLFSGGFASPLLGRA